jgi:hypothetical protein
VSSTDLPKPTKRRGYGKSRVPWMKRDPLGSNGLPESDFCDSLSEGQDMKAVVRGERMEQNIVLLSGDAVVVPP